ncbi:helix-turn-helix domain-containing protein [Viridibacillus arvi]|uniref:HTH cro/C1-type domain-containing protein n=1 Tax=Viridibacillus arvi TaxID=263475 RepID=A0A0M0LE44_9BACL|nr:helix-turn-helix domain-containing protein [Viridibacillus arvi]KOO48963.1 hypothetical protein AMD00_11190 [Viridibacillus arvi]
MKKIRIENVLEFSHSLMNEVVMNTARELNDAYFIIKVDDLLKERNLTQKDLANMTGMRIGTISEIINGKGISINKVQIMAIMVALRVTNLSDIKEIRLPEALTSTCLEESQDWTDSKTMPESVKEMYKENVLRANLGNQY